MKRSIALAVTLAVSGILLSLASSDSVSQAQRRRLFQWDTGVVALGPNQVLRIVGDWHGDGDTSVGFREIKYGRGACNGAVCKLVIIDTTTSGPPVVPAGEAISLDLVCHHLREGDTYQHPPRHARDASIINTTTGETTFHIIMANTEGRLPLSRAPRMKNLIFAVCILERKRQALEKLVSFTPRQNHVKTGKNKNGRVRTLP